MTKINNVFENNVFVDHVTAATETLAFPFTDTSSYSQEG